MKGNYISLINIKLLIPFEKKKESFALA